MNAHDVKTSDISNGLIRSYQLPDVVAEKFMASSEIVL